MKIKKQKFAVLSDGRKVHLYTVSNKEMSFSVTDYGCTLTSIVIPSKDGKKDDILLGYPTIDGYMNVWNFYIGVFVGRFANRIGDAQFTLNGKTYKLDNNDNGNVLHGGFDCWSRKIWDAKEIETAEGTGVKFTYDSPDGDQGLPGNVKAEVCYLLNDDNQLILRYRATTDADTPINFTNHAYYNLKGTGKGDVLDHEVTLNADSYLEVNKNLIPTGKKIPVKGTAFDFTSKKAIKTDIKATGFGYDHCYCLNMSKAGLTKVADVYEPETGRSMSISTNQPGVQFYTGNFLKDIQGKNGDFYNKHSGFCLETQAFPDAPNKPEFPNCILHPGEVYEAVTVESFKW